MLILSTLEAPETMPWPAMLREALVGAGFMGGSSGDGDEPMFRPGDSFLDYISFLGCSPVVYRLAEAEGAQGAEAGLRVRLPRPTREPRFVAGVDVASPRCPRCRHGLTEWSALVKAWEQAPMSYRWNCPHCGELVPIEDLDWRYQAGFGRLFVDVLGVYPFEAVPQDRLLTLLGTITDSRWRYFYAFEKG